MFCVNCGARLTDGKPFCAGCGARVEPAGSNQPAGGNQPATGNQQQNPYAYQPPRPAPYPGDANAQAYAPSSARDRAYNMYMGNIPGGYQQPQPAPYPGDAVNAAPTVYTQPSVNQNAQNVPITTEEEKKWL